ncbi:MAG TPA: hypothetical protein VGJ94_14800 [Syntrophorhabdaceae bacterium]|jgi:hypothetical protein
MEEREMDQKFSELFKDMLTVMESVRRGFFSVNVKMVKEEHEKFRNLLKARLDYAEKIIGEVDKGETEKKFVSLVIAFQTVALGLDNVMDRMEIKIESNTLFSEKAQKELKGLFGLIGGQVKDLIDYVVTKNPHLLAAIKKGKEDLNNLVDEYSVVHQNRLITGVCMPKASYLYIDITDSVKRMARGLVEFAEKV